MSAAPPAAGGRHAAQDGSDGGSRGRSRTQLIAWIAATGILLAGSGLVLVSLRPGPRAPRPHQPGPAATGCGLVACSAALPVTHPPAPTPARAASTRPAVTRATVPPPAPPPSPALPSTGPVPVARFFDNVGITSSASTGSGNLDGSGYTLSQEALADAGVMPGSVIWRGSASFTWPAAPAGQADNIVASGQTVPVGRSGSVLGLLVTATWGPASGTGTLRYGDGTSQSFTLTAPDWFQPPPEASVPLITMRYRNGPGNSQDDSRLAYVFYARIPLAPGKLLRAIVLPDISGPTPVADSPALHIFAMAVS